MTVLWLKVNYSTGVVTLLLYQAVTDNQEGQTHEDWHRERLAMTFQMGLIQTAPISKFNILMNFHKQARIISRMYHI